MRTILLPLCVVEVWCLTAAPSPLPRSAAAAGEQAVSSTLRAIDAGHLRLRLDLFGEAVEQPGPLPLGALCERLAKALGEKNAHFFFDTPGAAAAWATLPAASRCRTSLLSDGIMAADDDVLVLVRPCNRATATRTRHLEAVQQLVCGAGTRPVILANPELEALLLTARVGRAPAPMFLSDFEQTFFLAEALAKTGDVTAVRRVWGGAWETYRVEEATAPDEDLTETPTTRSQRRRHAVDGASTLQFSSLVHMGTEQPRAAEALVRHVRRERRLRRGATKLPTAVNERAAWSAEDGWG